MELGQLVTLGHQEPGLPFLIIGGHAVAAHGYSRTTLDTDILIPADDHSYWKERLEQTGLQLVNKSSSFAQYSAQHGMSGMDLMLVKRETFQPMWEASESTVFGLAQARVPCLNHLLALKLHVLKQGHADRTMKDATDVEMLVRKRGLNLRSQEYEQLFLKYGTREIYETFCRVTRPEPGSSMVPGP